MLSQGSLGMREPRQGPLSYEKSRGCSGQGLVDICVFRSRRNTS